MAFRHADPVPVETLQQMLQDSGLSKSEAARRLGWVVEKADTSRLNRQLGLAKHNNGSGQLVYGATVKYERAAEICEAWGLEPHRYDI